MKYINTIAKNEWPKPPRHTGQLPAGVIAAPADCCFFQPVPDGKQVVWVDGLPELADIPAKTSEELEAELIATRKRYSPKQFIERFTPDEVAALLTLSDSNISVRMWVTVLTGASFVDLLDPMIQNAMAWFVFEGHITQARHDDIMTLEFDA